MTDRAIRRSAALALALALAAGAAPATASTHHHADRRHEIRHRETRHRETGHRETGHHGGARHRTTSSRHRTTKAADRHDAKPSGVAGIPAGGIKLFCPAHRNPLLIRKSTQGAGTTVTVVCR